MHASSRDKCCLYEQERLLGDIQMKSMQIAILVRLRKEKGQDDKSDDSDKQNEDELDGKQGKDDDTEKNQGVVLIKLQGGKNIV